MDNKKIDEELKKWLAKCVMRWWFRYEDRPEDYFYYEEDSLQPLMRMNDWNPLENIDHAFMWIDRFETYALYKRKHNVKFEYFLSLDGSYPTDNNQWMNTQLEAIRSTAISIARSVGVLS